MKNRNFSKNPARNNPNRLHKPLVGAVVEALGTIFGKDVYADKVIERLLKSNRNWGSRDRAFIAESTYDIVRWWRYLWELYGKEPSLKRKELFHLFGIWWMYKGNHLPEDWRSFEAINHFNIRNAKSHMPNEVGTQQSFPIWFDALAQKELGSKWPQIAASLNQPAHLIARVNTLKTNREKVVELFKEQEIVVLPWEKNEVGIVFEKRQNLFNNKVFRDGFFEVQDGGSQLIGPYLEVKPGMKVIDACAGAGGKTLHIAAMMENKGSILAMDVEAWKLKELQKRARRNGVHNVEVRPIESSKTIKRLHESADRLLLDVPCSGTGVIKRNPDTKWKLQPDHLERVQGMQEHIINSYSKMLKKGGLMVYATCSILPAENNEQVSKIFGKQS